MLIKSAWDAELHTLRVTSLVCFSTGDFATLVWGRSTHTKVMDTALNETCLITGCLKNTSVNKLYILSCIAT